MNFKLFFLNIKVIQFKSCYHGSIATKITLYRHIAIFPTSFDCITFLFISYMYVCTKEETKLMLSNINRNCVLNFLSSLQQLFYNIHSNFLLSSSSPYTKLVDQDINTTVLCVVSFSVTLIPIKFFCAFVVIT